jgi:hypothetical protein
VKCGSIINSRESELDEQSILLECDQNPTVFQPNIGLLEEQALVSVQMGRSERTVILPVLDAVLFLWAVLERDDDEAD